MKLYYHNKCSEYKNNTSKLWHTINEIVGEVNDKSCVIDHITVNGVTDYTANGIGRAFGNFFSNVGKCYAEKIPTRKPYGFMQSSFWVIMMVHVMVCGDL